jgi:copper(I)-binding protein
MKKMILTLIAISSFNLFADDIEIKDARINPTLPGMSVTAIFMKITNNTKKDIRLTKITGEFAPTFELHNMEMSEGKMVMRPVDSILIKSHSTTELKSGGLHVMVFDAPKPIQKTKVYGAKLTFDNKEEIFTPIQVKD